MTYADSDRASYRTTCHRRDRDREFLARVMNAPLDELLRMLVTHHRGPAWKLVAIRRRIALAERK